MTNIKINSASDCEFVLKGTPEVIEATTKEMIRIVPSPPNVLFIMLCLLRCCLPSIIQQFLYMLTKKQLAVKIGESIRKLRESKRMSQEELADNAGFYRTYVGHLEVGRYMPSAFTLYKLVKALKVKSSEILPF